MHRPSTDKQYLWPETHCCFGSDAWPLACPEVVTVSLGWKVRFEQSVTWNGVSSWEVRPLVLESAPVNRIRSQLVGFSTKFSRLMKVRDALQFDRHAVGVPVRAGRVKERREGVCRYEHDRGPGVDPDRLAGTVPEPERPGDRGDRYERSRRGHLIAPIPLSQPRSLRPQPLHDPPWIRP
jgi:hypothetical protein